MSDQSQGPGWWQASDGKWYPPEQAPTTATPTTPTTAGPTVPPVPPTQPAAAPFPSTTPPSMPPPSSAAAPMPAPAPARSGLGTGPIIAIVVAAVAIIGAIVFFATKDDGNKKNTAATQSSSQSSTSSRSSSSSSRSSSSSGSGAPDVVAPAGFKVFSNDKDKFALAIPEQLDVIDLSGGDIDRLIQQLSATNPNLAKLGPQIKSIFQSGGKLFAIETAEAGGFNDNLNIIATKGSADVTTAAAKSQAESQLKSIGATNIDFQTVTAHGRKVLVASYQATVNTADGTPLDFFGHQAVVSAGGQIWFITFSSAADSSDAFQTIVQTFDVSG